MTVNLSVSGPKSTNDKTPADEENDKENNVPEITENVQADSLKENDVEEQTHIIPWRAQLRKTNSKLNLLE